jgi:putative serine protease PepD
MNRLSTFTSVVAGAIAGAIVALAISGGSGGSTRTVTTARSTAGSSPSSGSSAASTSNSIPTSLSKGQAVTINQIYRQDSPGVVDITVTSQTASPGGFFGGSGAQQTEGEGAGVVYDRQGDILTDEHVVANATSVSVHFQDGATAKARVLGTDPSTDVGVIKVDAPASELHPIPFANSNQAQVGDPVVAIGSPFSLPETVTSGIVSAVGRSITAPNNYTITGAIQTDAAINPGNSGGPLLDADGHVLGLNDQIQTSSGDSAGIGFATPGNTDVKIAQEIIAGQKPQHSYVGVELNAASTSGAQISRVEPGSPATAAGLQPGDVVTAINGKPVPSTAGFIATVGNFPPGQAITLTVKRGGQVKTLRLKLGNRPATSPTG